MMLLTAFMQGIDIAKSRRGAEALCHLFKPGSTFHVYPSITDIKAEPLFDIIVECIEEEFRPPTKHVDRGFCNVIKEKYFGRNEKLSPPLSRHF